MRMFIVKDFLKIVLILIALLLLWGCNSAAPEPESTPVPERPYNMEGELFNSPTLLGYIDTAVENLAEDAGVEQSEITFIELELKVWPDGHYGCPSQFDEEVEPDPEFKEGYKIHLRLNSRVYFYHGGEGIDPFLCEEFE